MDYSILLFILILVFYEDVCGIMLDPSPIAYVERYQNLTLTCTDSDVSTFVAFHNGLRNIALFTIENGGCREHASPDPTIYELICDLQRKTFTVTIINVTEAYDNNRFVCQTGHDNYTANTASTIILAIAPAASPTIQQTPIGPIIKGNNVTLTCLVSGGNPLPTLSWNCSGTYINNTSGNTTSLSVYIRVEKSDNNKICTCSATHLVTSYRPIIHHTLTVYYPATLRLNPDKSLITVTEGQTVTINCEVVDAFPLVNSYKWYRNNTRLLSGLRASTLTLQDVSLSDSGIYSCQALNGILPDGQVTISLYVEDVPYVSSQTIVECTTGQSIMLNCRLEKATSSYTPFRWIHLQLSERKRLLNGTISNNSFQLNISACSSEDQGVYICVWGGQSDQPVVNASVIVLVYDRRINTIDGYSSESKYTIGTLIGVATTCFGIPAVLLVAIFISRKRCSTAKANSSDHQKEIDRCVSSYEDLGMQNLPNIYDQIQDGGSKTK